MSTVSVSFNANELKRDVSEIIGRKIRAVTTNSELKKQLQELFYTYVIKLSDFPQDTGALKLISDGIAKNGYYRYPAGSWGGHHGIEFDAVEERPKGPHHYAKPALERFFGDPVSQGFVDAMKSEGLWDAFCKEAAPIIAEFMNNG